MVFNSALKGLKLLKKNPGNGRLNNLNYLVLNVLSKQNSFSNKRIEYNLAYLQK